MRKLFVILLIAISFALGMVSQNLVAGNWVVPKYGTPAPVLKVGDGRVYHRGEAWYDIPSSWKVAGTKMSSQGRLIVIYKKLE